MEILYMKMLGSIEKRTAGVAGKYGYWNFKKKEFLLIDKRYNR